MRSRLLVRDLPRVASPSFLSQQRIALADYDGLKKFTAIPIREDANLAVIRY